MLLSESADTATRDLRGTSADGKRISERSNPTSQRLSGAQLFPLHCSCLGVNSTFQLLSLLFPLYTTHTTTSVTMSFLGGAECSTAGNPLTQFTKHVQDDKSLQRDRLVGRGPGMQEGMRSRGMMGGQDQVRSWNVAANPTLSRGREGSQRRPVYRRIGDPATNVKGSLDVPSGAPIFI